METLIGLFFLGSVGFYLYLRFKEKEEEEPSALERFNKRSVSKINKSKHFDPPKENSTSDNVKYLKSTLKKLRKEAEKIERYDEDGLDKVNSEIKHIEKIIHPYEVDQLLKKVTDLRSYRALERKYENTDYGETISYGEIERRETVLEEAFYTAGEKPYKYLLCADIYVDTPLSILEKIGKVYSHDEAMEIKISCSDCRLDVITFGEINDLDMYIDECKEEIEESGIKDLIKLRIIVENDELDSLEKEQKVNSLVLKSDVLKELYFDDYSNDDYYHQYLFKLKVQELAEYDIPKVEEFISRSYTTVEEIVNVPADEINLWNGIGKITLEKIVNAQDKLRR